MRQRDRDIFEPVGVGRPGFSKIPVDFSTVGTFKRRDGSVEKRVVSMHYDRWGYRLNFGIPSE